MARAAFVIRLLGALLLATSAFVACVSRLSIVGSACPCPSGYCCVDGKCAASGGSACAPQMSLTTGEPPAADAVDATSASGDLAAGCDGGIAALCDEPPQDGEPCNPLCQTGCGACERCTVLAGHALCVSGRGAAQPGEACVVPNSHSGCAPGSVCPHDGCAPGSVCLPESCAPNLGRCYRLCANDDPCESGTCSVPLVGPTGGRTPYQVCTTPPWSCDPVGQTGCPSSKLRCFVRGAQTFCGCSNIIP